MTTWDLIGGPLCGQAYQGDAELHSVALKGPDPTRRHVYAVERPDDAQMCVLRWQGAE